MAGIDLTGKIQPKNDAFRGLVDAKQVIGGDENFIPVEAVPPLRSSDNSIEIIRGATSINFKAGASAGVVIDPDYVHTDNNLTDELESLINSAIQTETDPVYTGDKPFIALKSEIPTQLDQLASGPTSRLTTDVQQLAWSSKQDDLGLGSPGQALTTNLGGTGLDWKTMDVTYSGTAERTVGGIVEGRVFDEANIKEIIDTLIKQEKNPLLFNPTSTFTSSITGFREVGEVINLTFNSTFDRGAISPQYTADSPFRSGLPNVYQFTGTGLVNQSKTDLTDSQSVSNYTVLINGQSWQGRVAYDAGVQPKTSYDNDYSTLLVAGNTTYITRTLTGVYPYFGTTYNISTLTKQALVAHGSVITITLIEESGGNKQEINIPQIWGVLSKLEQYNPFTSAWDIIASSTFTQSSNVVQVQGQNVNYIKYTHNGSLIGTRQLKLTF